MTRNDFKKNIAAGILYTIIAIFVLWWVNVAINKIIIAKWSRSNDSCVEVLIGEEWEPCSALSRLGIEDNEVQKQYVP